MKTYVKLICAILLVQIVIFLLMNSKNYSSQQRDEGFYERRIYTNEALSELQKEIVKLKNENRRLLYNLHKTEHFMGHFHVELLEYKDAFDSSRKTMRGNFSFYKVMDKLLNKTTALIENYRISQNLSHEIFTTKSSSDRIFYGEKTETKTSDLTSKRIKTATRTLLRPDRHPLANDIGHFVDMVTIILYEQGNWSYHCIRERAVVLSNWYPGIRVLHGEGQTPWEVFNRLFPQVKSKYFLFLDVQHKISKQTSDHSVGWLLHALEQVPELDFVSGSILNSESQLEIPCYRMRLCNWTFSLSYEYERSIDELMICEMIASSFMGRTSSISKLVRNGSTSIFNVELQSMSHVDFFLRAKRAGAISGVRPEVMLEINANARCTSSKTILTGRKLYQSLLPFAREYKIFKIKNHDGSVLDLCRFDSPIVGEDICSEEIAHQVMLGGGHWAYKGTYAYPYVIENLQNCLGKFTEFLSSKNISYMIDGGVVLGALKMKAVLPWEAGDIDMCLFGDSLEPFAKICEEFAKTNNYQFYKSGYPFFIYCAPPKAGRNGPITLFLCKGKPPVSIRLQANGNWFSVSKDVFRQCRGYYKTQYLSHRMFKSSSAAHCMIEGHNACLPDFRSVGGFDGTAGTFREFLLCEP